MKVTGILGARGIFPLCAAIVFSACITSCNKSIDDISEVPEQVTPKKTVGVVTRSTSAIEYPITLYAFNATGNLAQSVTAEGEEDALEMELAVGSYHLVAMAGTSGLDEVDSPAANASIGVPEDGLIGSAVQMGSADINVASEDVNVNIVMSYQVAQVNVELQDIPADVEEVSITLSSIYTDETFYGTMSRGKAITIPLEKEPNTEGTWYAPTVYTLPGSSTQLTLSISMDNETYGYTHSSNLKAATPYTLIGSFKDGFKLTGTVTAAGWNTAEEIAFTFGINPGDDTPIINPAPDGSYNVEEIPSIKTIWNGHFVAKVTNKGDTSAELLLMSLNEWDATNADASTVASSAVNSYTEDDMRNWRIPTSEELISIFPTFSTSNEIDKVNKALVNEGQGVKLTNSEPYLCNEAMQYVLLSSNPMAMSLVASQDYHLRLVKTVTVVKSE